MWGDVQRDNPLPSVPAAAERRALQDAQRRQDGQHGPHHPVPRAPPRGVRNLTLQPGAPLITHTHSQWRIQELSEGGGAHQSVTLEMKEFWFTRGAIPEFRHCSILTTPSSACLTYNYLQLCNISSIARGRQVNTLVLHMRIVIGWNKNSWLPFPVRNTRGSYSWNLKKIQETSYPYIHPKTQTQSTNDCTRGAIATDTFENDGNMTLQNSGRLLHPGV